MPLGVYPAFRMFFYLEPPILAADCKMPTIRTPRNGASDTRRLNKPNIPSTADVPNANLESALGRVHGESVRVTTGVE